RTASAQVGNRDDDLVADHLDWVADEPDVWIEERPPGRDVVLPLVPGTAQHPTLQTVLELVDLRGQGGAAELAQTDPRALMGADVLERVERAVEVEDADLAALHAHDLASAGWDLAHPGDDVPSHRSRLASGAGDAVRRQQPLAVEGKRVLDQHRPTH